MWEVVELTQVLQLAKFQTMVEAGPNGLVSGGPERWCDTCF